MIIDKLSKGYIPSQIPQLIDRAVKMSLEEEEMRLEMKKDMRVLKYIAYVIDPKGSISRAARYLIGLSGKTIGVAVEKREDIAIMSLRARRDAIDLNDILRKLARKYDGSGGGHPHAAGARVPSSNLENFLQALDKEVGKFITHHEYPLHITP
jgi:RecJ-like exonuclease